MKCIVQGCPGEMEERRIMHTFVRGGKPIVVEDLPAWVCPVCGYTVLDLESQTVNLDMLVWTEGQQFSEAELRKMLSEAGFRAIERIPTAGYCAAALSASRIISSGLRPSPSTFLSSRAASAGL